jgi:hypothetical protein
MIAVFYIKLNNFSYQIKFYIIIKRNVNQLDKRIDREKI